MPHLHWYNILRSIWFIIPQLIRWEVSHCHVFILTINTHNNNNNGTMKNNHTSNLSTWNTSSCSSSYFLWIDLFSLLLHSQYRISHYCILKSLSTILIRRDMHLLKHHIVYTIHYYQIFSQKAATNMKRLHLGRIIRKSLRSVDFIERVIIDENIARSASTRRHTSRNN